MVCFQDRFLLVKDNVSKMWTFVSSDGKSELCFKEKQEPKLCRTLQWSLHESL